MAEIVVISFISYVQAVKNLYQQGDITLEQYAGCLRRAKMRMVL